MSELWPPGRKYRVFKVHITRPKSIIYLNTVARLNWTVKDSKGHTWPPHTTQPHTVYHICTFAHIGYSVHIVYILHVSSCAFLCTSQAVNSVSLILLLCTRTIKNWILNFQVTFATFNFPYIFLFVIYQIARYVFAFSANKEVSGTIPQNIYHKIFTRWVKWAACSIQSQPIRDESFS